MTVEKGAGGGEEPPTERRDGEQPIDREGDRGEGEEPVGREDHPLGKVGPEERRPLIRVEPNWWPSLARRIKFPARDSSPC